MASLCIKSELIYSLHKCSIWALPVWGVRMINECKKKLKKEYNSAFPFISDSTRVGSLETEYRNVDSPPRRKQGEYFPRDPISQFHVRIRRHFRDVIIFMGNFKLGRNIPPICF